MAEKTTELSRDVRTSINTVIGMINLAKRTLNSPEQAEEYLDLAEQGAIHLLHRLEGRSQNNSAVTDIHPQTDMPFHIRELVEEVQFELLPELHEHGQQLSIEYENLEHGHLIGDWKNLQKIFIHILSKVSKLSPAGSALELIVSECPGLDKSRAAFEFVFNTPYAEPSLSITESIISMLGGTLSVTGRPDRGSVFIVHLKFTVATEEVLKKLEENDRSINGMTILIAEDNALNQDILHELLEMENVSIDVANDGLDALKQFISHGRGYYDAILMDIQMPLMNGYETTDCIRSCTDIGGDSVPIIAVTSDAMPEDVEKALRHGMNGHLAKPFNAKNLIDALSFWKRRSF